MLRFQRKRLEVDASRGFQLFSIVRQSTALIVSVILAKSSLSLSDIGTYEIWMFLGLVLTFFTISGPLQVFLSRASKVKGIAQKQAIFTVYFILWTFTSIVAALIYIYRSFFFEQLLHVEIPDGLAKVLIFLLLHLNASLVPYLLLVKEKSKIFLPYCLAYLIFGVLAVFVPIIYFSSLHYVLNGLIIWGGLEQVFLVFLIVKWASFSLQRDQIVRFLALSFPLVIYAGSGFLAQVFDTWLVTFRFADLGTFAIFKYGAREVPGALALSSAFSLSMIVQFTGNHDQGIDRIYKSSRRFFNIFFPLSFVLMFMSDWIFSFIYDEEFLPSVIIFDTYLLLVVCRWVFPQTFVLANEDNLCLVWIGAVELIINVVVSLWLVSFWGLQGIAIGTVVAFFFEKIALVVLVWRRYNIHPSRYIPISRLLLFSVVITTLYILKL